MVKPMHQQHTVPSDQAGQRLDRYLKQHWPTTPFVGLQKLLRQGVIRLNGRKVAGTARLQAGDVITHPTNLGHAPAHAPARVGHAAYQATKADATMLKQATVYEDQAILVLNKPAGLPAQAGGGQVRSLDRIFAGLYGDKAPRLCHRLDRETTGLLVCAKNRTNAANITAQFSEKTTQKSYLALVVGTLPAASGSITAPIAKSGAVARVSESGSVAHTTWQRLATLQPQLHLLRCTPHTGRMNQLRVHLQHIGLPIVGDDKYTNPTHQQLSQQTAAWLGLKSKQSPFFLHAHQLTFTHPKTQAPLSLTAPLPAHFVALQPHLPAAVATSLGLILALS